MELFLTAASSTTTPHATSSSAAGSSCTAGRMQDASHSTGAAVGAELGCLEDAANCAKTNVEGFVRRRTTYLDSSAGQLSGCKPNEMRSQPSRGPLKAHHWHDAQLLLHGHHRSIAGPQSTSQLPADCSYDCPDACLDRAEHDIDICKVSPSVRSHEDFKSAPP